MRRVLLNPSQPISQGEQAREVFVRSKLSNEKLSQIWCGLILLLQSTGVHVSFVGICPIPRTVDRWTCPTLSWPCISSRLPCPANSLLSRLPFPLACMKWPLINLYRAVVSLCILPEIVALSVPSFLVVSLQTVDLE